MVFSQFTCPSTLHDNHSVSPLRLNGPVSGLRDKANFRSLKEASRSDLDIMDPVAEQSSNSLSAGGTTVDGIPKDGSGISKRAIRRFDLHADDKLKVLSSWIRGLPLLKAS